MEEIIIFEKKYVQAESIIKDAPIYCKGVRNGRELIKKKEIDQKYFIYARLINNEWIQSEGKSVKFDKVLIKKSYIKKIPELNEENNKITDDKGVEKAPNIIILEDNEKFKDNEGNIVEIETRGEREVDKIYFKVKDVMIGFNMPNLYTTIIDKRTEGYIVNTHYKYFNCENKPIKELFLTFSGFKRMIETSRICLDSVTKNKITKWLYHIFDKTPLKPFTINIKNSIIRRNEGYVYIVRSKMLNAVKIGMWRSTIEGLYGRYVTVYGKDIEIDYFYTSDARELERKTHENFRDYNITNELFDKNHVDEYMEFIKNNVTECKYDLIEETMSICEYEYKTNEEEINILKHKYELMKRDMEIMELRMKLLERGV
jgi:hypothetical protein